MIYYILQVVAFQLVFLMVYDAFLKRETFFNCNRFYLLATAVLSFLLPFIKIDQLKVLAPKDFVVTLPEVIIGKIDTTVNLSQTGIIENGIATPSSISIFQIILIGGIAVSAFAFLFKFFKIFRLKAQNPKRWRGDILIVKLLKSTAAFSFFNTVFLGEKIAEEDQPTILKHEIVHVKQWHTVDLLLFEVMRIVMWFNPLVYMYQNRVKTLHEYIADQAAVKQNGKKDYYQQLLNQIFETKNVSFINTFFNKSLIKNRIVMLQKSKSKKVSLLKYALMVPVVFAMLFSVSCDTEIGSRDSIDLSKYNYSMSLDANMDSETKKVHDKYEEFLKTNKDYVGWAIIDKESGLIEYSVHHKDKSVSEEYTEAVITGPDGRSYKSYMNFNYFDLATTKKMTEIQKLNPRDYDGKADVPFTAVDHVPVFSDCKDLLTNEEKKKCISQEISKIINRNFNMKLAKDLDLSGKQKIYTIFKINKEGNVVEVKARAPHPALEVEAKRTINLLPKFTPGVHDGKPVNVTYSLPIVFQINP